jgi:hypothetical protein
MTAARYFPLHRSAYASFAAISGAGAAPSFAEQASTATSNAARDPGSGFQVAIRSHPDALGRLAPLQESDNPAHDQSDAAKQ